MLIAEDLNTSVCVSYTKSMPYEKLVIKEKFLCRDIPRYLQDLMKKLKSNDHFFPVFTLQEMRKRGNSSMLIDVLPVLSIKLHTFY